MQSVNLFVDMLVTSVNGAEGALSANSYV